MGVARPASACTCAPFDTRAALASSDAAFVGTLLSRTDPPPALPGAPAATTESIYRFRVDQAVKGDLGAEVEVRSPTSEAACGLSAPPGRAVGLLLRERDGQYHGDLCHQPSPERLTRAAGPLPPPDGSLPPLVVVGSTYGNGRSVALDAQGRVAGVGTGPGATLAVAVCPDRHRVVELFAVEQDGGADTFGITVRRLDTMASEVERLLPELAPDPAAGTGPVRAEALACRGAGGEDVVLFVRSGSGAGETGRFVHVVSGQAPVTLWEGAAPRAAAFGPNGATAYLNLAPQGEEVAALALDTPGEPRPVVRVPAGSGPMVVSPDGRRLATVAVAPSRVSQVVSVDLGSSPPAVATADLGGAGVSGDLQWLGDNLVFMPHLRPAEAVRIYDPGLNILASWAGWTAEHSVVIGERLYGTSQGAVRSAPLTTGPGSIIRELEDALVVSIADTSPPPADPPEPPPTTTTTTTAPPPAPTTTTTAEPPAPTTTTSTVPPETTTTTSPPPPPGPDPEDPAEVAGRTASEGGGSAGGALLLGGALLVAAAGATGYRVRRRRSAS